MIIPIPFLFLKDKNKKDALLVIWTVASILLYTFHGDFSADFSAYKNMFHQYAQYDWSNVLSVLSLYHHLNVVEIGYVLLNFLISRFTTNYLYMQILQSLIICIPVALYIHKSDKPLLSIALYLSIGTYLESFNSVRGMMAASICFYGYTFIETHELKKYIITIFLASLIHMSAIMILPFYWLLQLQPSIRKLLFFCVFTLLISVFIQNIAYVYNLFFKVADLGSLSELLYRNKISFKNIAVFIFFSISAIGLFYFNIYKQKKQNKVIVLSREEIILYNGTLYWTLLKLLMLSTSYMTRYAAYFSCFVLIFFPKMFTKFIPVKYQKYFDAIVFVLCFIYYLMQTTGYGNYYIL